MNLKNLSPEEVAFLSAEHDEGLLDQLSKKGFSRERVQTFISNLRDQFKSGDLDCREIKPVLKRYLKKGPRAQSFVQDYRKRIQEWVRNPAGRLAPHQLDLHQLPPLTSQTLNEYLAYFEEKLVSFLDHFNSKYKNYENMGPENGGDILDLEDQFLCCAKANCEMLVKEFIEESEVNARQFLLYIFELDDSVRIEGYKDLTETALQKLSDNIHFLRSLFNLLNENIFEQSTIKRIDANVTLVLLEKLIELGVCETWVDEPPNTDFTRPRTTHDLNHITSLGTPEGEREIVTNVRIPTQLVPAHWNGHRLVNPALNHSFNELGNILNTVERNEEMQNEAERHLNGLVDDRRYASNFTRVKVNDIPDTENMDIWFNYFCTSRLRPGEIGVEVVINGASTVFFLDEEGILTVRENGNLNPPLPPDELGDPNHIDSLAVSPLAWLTENGLTNLYIYILKYAHHLFVEPRTESENSSPGGEGLRGNQLFNIRLTEHTSTITIPSSSPNSEPGDGRRSRITVYHDVTGHIRELPEGWRPSQEAIRAAREHNIFLVPGQTFVKHYHKGSELAEETSSKKKVNN